MTPNWHPTIVHFPIALLLTGIAALWIGALLRDSEFNRQLQTVGHWNLRAGFIFSIIAMISGVFAYLSVPRDAAALEAMNVHYAWSGVVVAAFLPFFILSCLRHRLTPHIKRAFTAGLIIPALPLVYTIWLGNEAVYRYGLGVQQASETESVPRQTQPPGTGGETRSEGRLPHSGDMRYPDPELKDDDGDNSLTGGSEPPSKPTRKTARGIYGTVKSGNTRPRFQTPMYTGPGNRAFRIPRPAGDSGVLPGRLEPGMQR